METVEPYNFSGYSMSLAQFFGKGPMFHVSCGKCRSSFSKRVPMVDYPGLRCPECGAVNILPVTINDNDDP